MQVFRFIFIQNKHDENTKMWLADTDSIICEIKAENVMKSFTKIKRYLILVVSPNIQNITKMQIT